MKLNRSTLCVPGHIEKMHHSAAQSAADVIMLDLEDSVPVNQKKKARQTIIESLLNIDFQGKKVNLRINSLDTPFAYRDIIEVVEAVGNKISNIVIPKVNHEGDIHFASRLLDGIEIKKKIPNKIRLQAGIETARGLERVTEIARSDKRLAALAFGIADYCASIGAKLISLSGHGENEADLYPGHRWHYPISRMVMAAKANDIMAIDAPFGNFKNLQGLERSAALAAALGCDGKWVIHPNQIDVVNQVFTPSIEEIKLASQVLDMIKKADTSFRGAIAVDGRMVDLATARLATKVWNQAVSLGLVKEQP